MKARIRAYVAPLLVIAVSWGVTWMVRPRGDRVAAMESPTSERTLRTEIPAPVTVAESYEQIARTQEQQGRLKEALFNMRVAAAATPEDDREALARRSAAVNRVKRGLELRVAESKPE